jgi:hypothetical protein
MIGTLAAIAKISHDVNKKRLKNKRLKKVDALPHQTSEPVRPAIPLPAAPTVYWIAARRDGAVWAGPWKSDGVGFTRVPKNYWKFKSREAAQSAIDSDHLENCEPQELDPE